VSETDKSGKERLEPHIRVVDRRWWARTDGQETAGEPSARKPTYVEELERQLAERSAQLQTYIAEHRRSLQEFDNARARLKRDTTREIERAKRTVLVELLDVVDNLDRAIAAARAGTGSADALETLTRGVELVRDQFLAKLAAIGATRVAALGQPFDAARHEAVSTMPVTDLAQDGMVVAVTKEGYSIGDEVLRPASVVVGRFEKQHP
jgi:molecular chaperone GrpE